MKRRNYIFTNKRHSQKAIMSTILGMISLVALVAVLYLSYRRQGAVPAGYGVTGFLATVYSLVGCYLGMTALKDKNYFPFFSWLGLILNLLALGAIGVLVYFGNYR